MRRWLAFLGMAVVGVADTARLAQLLDPFAAGYLLEPLADGAVARLSGQARLVARGFAPVLYRAAPAEPDALLQDGHLRSALHPGFGYGERLAKKRKALLRAGARRSAVMWLRDLDQVQVGGYADFLRNAALAGTLRRRAFGRRGRSVAHMILALRHSERQFRDWLVAECTRRIKTAVRPEESYALLRGWLRSPQVRRRGLAARLLAQAPRDDLADDLDRALQRERDPVVQGALVVAWAALAPRLPHARVRDSFQLLVRDDRFGVRAAAVHACLGMRWAQGVMRERYKRERGRLHDDMARVLASDAYESDGPVDFYGIRTHSRRVVFCIDVSTSMKFPMDGKNGKREPRHWRTKREIRRAISKLPTHTEFNILLFATTVVSWRPRLTRATPANREQALDFLETQPLRPGTHPTAALGAIFASGADTAYLLSDGEPSTDPFLDPALIVEESARQNPYGRVVIHTIGLSRDQHAELLVNIAARHGGKYVADR